MTEKLSLQLRLSIAVLSFLSGIGLLIYPPALFSPEANKAAALSIVVLSLWATGIIAEHLTSLLFFLLAMLFSISRPDIVFSGFQSTAFWLVFGGLLLGFGITDSGLADRIAFYVISLIRSRYAWLIVGTVIMGILFSFLIPSATGRTVLLTPIAVSIAGHFGFSAGSNGQKGIVTALIISSVLPAFAILPANVANMVLAGMSETHLKVPILYGEYLLLHFPVLGLLKAALIVVLILWIYPDRPQKKESKDLSANKPFSTNEIIVSTVTVVLLILWMSDFIHHISPAWVALGGALVLLLPKIQIIGIKQFNQKINYGSLFFLAGILGFGGIVSHTGLGDALAGKLIGALPLAESRPFLNYMLLNLVSMFTGILTTVAGVPAVMMSFSDNLAQLTGIPLKTIMMTQVLGFSTIMMPYQAPSLVIGAQIAGIKVSSVSKFFLILALLTIFVLWPIDYLWWLFLGWI